MHIHIQDNSPATLFHGNWNTTTACVLGLRENFVARPRWCTSLKEINTDKCIQCLSAFCSLHHSAAFTHPCTHTHTHTHTLQTHIPHAHTHTHHMHAQRPTLLTRPTSPHKTGAPTIPALAPQIHSSHTNSLRVISSLKSVMWSDNTPSKPV